MATKQTSSRGEWTSQIGFIFAAIGSAVGLGNIWRFPGVAYENGGGAFLIPYIVALFTTGIPFLFFDYAVGHRFRGSSPLALRRAAGKPGEMLGWLHVVICLVIAVYYTVVVAWTASYFVFSFNLSWNNAKSPTTFFTGKYLQLSEEPLTFEFVPHILLPLIAFWLIALIIVSAGVTKGLQRSNTVFIPLLMVSFVALIIGAVSLPGAAEGLNAFFTPNFEALKDPGTWISAYGQIFFSLSIAFGIMVTYSSYRKRKSNMTGPGLVVAFANSSFELLAGIGVFSALGFFATQQGTTIDQLHGLSGVSLAFMTFPAVVSQMPIAPVFGVLFFGSLLIAGLTSLISIIEVVVSGFVDKFNFSRRKTVWVLGLILMGFSILFFATTSGLYVLDTVDKFTNEVAIVMCAIVMCVLLLLVRRRGYELSQHMTLLSTFPLGRTWRFFVTFVSPVVIAVMFVQVTVNLIQEGYSGYQDWFVGIFGWGTLALMLVVAIVFTVMPWKRDPERFVAWPPIQPRACAKTREAAVHTGESEQTEEAK